MYHKDATTFGAENEATNIAIFTPMNPLIINFAPTGMVPTKAMTPHVPVSPDEIVEQVHEAYEIGITIAHLHARDDEGKPTYRSAVYRDIFEGVRKHCPELVVCASLSGRNFPELEKRTEVLSLKPDMGSLTLGSLNFPQQASVNAPEILQQLIEAMDAYGVKPELECFDVGMINYSKYLIRKGILSAPFYYNIIFGNIFGAQAEMTQMGTAIRELPENSLWAFGGIGRAQQTANSVAMAMGGGVRVGVEDNIWIDAGKTELATNRNLVLRTHALAKIHGRRIMSGSEFGEKGFYNTSVKS